jgi:hypothetical protein
MTEQREAGPVGRISGGGKAMAKDAIVSDDLAKKFATEKETPYTRWIAQEGLDIIGAHYVRNLRTVDLKPWARRGGSGVYINHEASRTSNDCYVCEIPAGGKLAPQRQLFEEMILVLEGRGSTTVWNDEGARITFEWQAGALFRHPAQHLAPAFQRIGQRGRALRRRDQPAAGDQPLRRHRLHLQHRARLQEPLQRRAGLLLQQGGAEGPAPADQLRRRCGQPAADLGQGARRGWRPYPLLHGQGLDEQPHLAVPAGDLQEGPPPTGRARM